jgi:Lon protease-like protein
MFTNMMTIDDLPHTLAIFPLQDVILCPEGLLPLNIFEPRYIRMVDDAIASHRIIGIIQPDMILRDKGDKTAVMSIGCAGRITEFSETGDGRYYITLKGLSRFKIELEMPTILPYRQIIADWSPYQDDMIEDCDTISIDRNCFLPLLKAYFAHHNLSCDMSVIQQSSCKYLMATLPMICPFNAQEKQALLEAKTLDSRYEAMITLMKMSINSKDSGCC